jgi:hypothetical protein
MKIKNTHFVLFITKCVFYFINLLNVYFFERAIYGFEEKPIVDEAFAAFENFVLYGKYINSIPIGG